MFARVRQQNVSPPPTKSLVHLCICCREADMRSPSVLYAILTSLGEMETGVFFFSFAVQFAESLFQICSYPWGSQVVRQVGMQR